MKRKGLTVLSGGITLLAMAFVLVASPSCGSALDIESPSPSALVPVIDPEDPLTDNPFFARDGILAEAPFVLISGPEAAYYDIDYVAFYALAGGVVHGTTDHEIRVSADAVITVRACASSGMEIYQTGRATADPVLYPVDSQQGFNQSMAPLEFRDVDIDPGQQVIDGIEQVIDGIERPLTYREWRVSAYFTIMENNQIVSEVLEKTFVFSLDNCFESDLTPTAEEERHHESKS